MERLVPGLKSSDQTAASLLIECRGHNARALQASIAEVSTALKKSGLAFGGNAKAPVPLDTYSFQHDPKVRLEGIRSRRAEVSCKRESFVFERRRHLNVTPA
jgi:hypothetical protein